MSERQGRFNAASRRWLLWVALAAAPLAPLLSGCRAPITCAEGQLARTEDQRCADEPRGEEAEKDRRREEQRKIEEKSIAAAQEARAGCAALRCKPKELPKVRFVCHRGPGAPGPGGVLVSDPPCTVLAQQTDDPRFGCLGDFTIEPYCEPPPQPRPPCHAGPSECCAPDGKIVRPCGPITPPGSDCNAAATCGGGGWCTPCRCLPPGARITTPGGAVPIRSLSVGDAVTVVDAQGRRRTARVVRVARTLVAGAHVVLAVELSDGRRVVASGPHPLSDGRPLDAVAAGDAVDGARVIRVTRLPFTGDAAWDLLTDAPGAAYLADGVPLASTLEPVRPGAAHAVKR